MKVDLNWAETVWIMNALQHYVDDSKAMIAEYDPNRSAGESSAIAILQTCVEGRQTLIDKLEKASRKEATRK